MASAGMARTLPAGRKASAWPLLDGHARQLLLAETIAANPGLTVAGEVDYASAAEPLLWEPASGNYWSLAGELVGPLAVDLAPGGRRPAGLDGRALIGAALLGIALGLTQ